jgi:hypothetical protein
MAITHQFVSVKLRSENPYVIRQRDWNANHNDAVTVTSPTSAYDIAITDELIICNSSIAFTVTLPVAAASGRKLFIKNINTGAITVDGNGSDTIDGETTQTVYQWECMQIVDYEANKWVII